ncbi:MAG: sulfur transferase domain-containing protein [Burkholderiaceae bacterium]
MTSITTARLSADVCAAAQLVPEDMATAYADGFRSVVNNRPDHEGGPTQPTSAAIEAAAKAAGLVYAYLPVAPTVQSAEEAAALTGLLATLPKPVLMFCRSGGRSARLFSATQSH